MRFTQTYLFILVFILFPFILFSQKAPVKYGKLSDLEKTITETELDPDANAVILADHGTINFQGGTLSFFRHVRIKILNTNGLDEANITLPYYSKDKNEKFSRIKAQTLNVNEKGLTEKIKLGKKDFYDVDVSENWSEKRFTFKDVKVGSIIEYDYEKISKNSVSLEEWRFQNTLPTLLSQIDVSIRQGLDYKILYKGNRLIQKYGNESLNSWMLENLPPLKEEPYCPNPEDYVQSIKFQLAGYKDNDNRYVKLMDTWENLAEEILDIESYKDILNNRKAAKKMVQEIISESDSDLEKVKKIYTYVQENLNWDDSYRMFPDEKFTTIMEQKRGSSAEINLCLVKLLQSAGLDANPVIISTKRNGMVTKVYPIYNQFNHVLAQVKVKEKDVLMDAVSDFRPYNLLSSNDLNFYGYLLSKKEPRWIDLKSPKKTRTIIVTDLKFGTEQINYKISYSFFLHEAAKFRSRYISEKGENSFVTKYLLENGAGSDIVLDSFEVRNEDNLEKPFSVVCHFSKPMDLDEDIIYLDPMIKKHFSKNPFINPIRYLPVDFVFPSSEKFILNLQFPEGYSLAEKPESIKLSTPSNKSQYAYLFNNVSPTQIQLSSQLTVSDPFIMPDEYVNLREMFSQIMGKQAEQLVLKKN